MNRHFIHIDNISVGYSGLKVIHRLSLHVEKGETVCLLGANGAGKSTLLRAIMGVQKISEGRIMFMDKDLSRLRTEEIVNLGIICVPEERMLFAPLSIEENLVLGAYTLKNRDQIEKNLQYVYGLFPRLHERRTQAVSTLSGGEQQMVAIGRGLMSNPTVLMLDEPSFGLAPMLVDEVLDTVRRLREGGITIILVEQNAREALDLADRGYVIQTGEIMAEGTGEELLASSTIRSAYLGL
ncbi:MAG: ABC transporter ATP-binding protein [Deltaproteobacteria bacterium]|nr:ABC transporter ATP-binding protein [Deltaproteobacteria bacterium]